MSILSLFFKSQVASGTLLFLFNILLCCFLGPFCPDAEELGIGTGHGKPGKHPAVLLCRALALSLRMFRGGVTRPVSWVATLASSAELSPSLGAMGLVYRDHVACSAFVNPLRS